MTRSASVGNVRADNFQGRPPLVIEARKGSGSGKESADSAGSEHIANYEQARYFLDATTFAAILPGELTIFTT
jgi:hypothetical protein